MVDGGAQGAFSALGVEKESVFFGYSRYSLTVHSVRLLLSSPGAEPASFAGRRAPHRRTDGGRNFVSEPVPRPVHLHGDGHHRCRAGGGGATRRTLRCCPPSNPLCSAAPCPSRISRCPAV